MVLFLQLASYLSSSLSALIHLVPSAIEASVSARRIMSVLELPREQLDHPERAQRLVREGVPLTLSLQGLEFSYQGRAPVLKQLDLQVERVSVDKLLELLPEALRPSYAPLVRESDPTVHDIVKAADKLSAHIKCIEELRAGNQEFASAAEQTRQALTDMHLPELDWFLEHCLDSFGKNLDQLE